MVFWRSQYICVSRNTLYRNNCKQYVFRFNEKYYTYKKDKMELVDIKLLEELSKIIIKILEIINKDM